MEIPAPNPPASKKSPDLSIILTPIFLVVVLVQMHSHVMWRGGRRTWQIARESTGLVSLGHAMRFDAVPILWNAIVFFLTRLFDNPAAMQVAHALIAAAVVFVVARWSPFSSWQKVLFALGYFPL